MGTSPRFDWHWFATAYNRDSALWPARALLKRRRRALQEPG